MVSPRVYECEKFRISVLIALEALIVCLQHKCASCYDIKCHYHYRSPAFTHTHTRTHATHTDTHTPFSTAKRTQTNTAFLPTPFSISISINQSMPMPTSHAFFASANAVTSLEVRDVRAITQSLRTTSSSTYSTVIFSTTGTTH
mmetsp:Transcript_8100/g.19843  ORF Transcript_8100/g.19843 Transcript_8100/m.19843 type:complete len:144 (-) Transcript_8100:5087-5518(-)